MFLDFVLIPIFFLRQWIRGGFLQIVWEVEDCHRPFVKYLVWTTESTNCFYTGFGGDKGRRKRAENTQEEDNYEKKG